MTFGAVFPRVFRPAFGPGLAAVAAAANWWEAGGASGAVAAYQPKGAASLAASYINLANPGTYDAAPGVAPTWDSGTGWTFDGLTQYLSTNLSAEIKPFSAILRVNRPAGFGVRTMLGSVVANGWQFRFAFGSQMQLVKQNTATIGTSSSVVTTDDVCAITYSGSGDYVFYLNGSSNGSGTNNQTANSGAKIVIGANNGMSEFHNSWIAVIAIYSTTLTAPQVAAISTAMAAL